MQFTFDGQAAVLGLISGSSLVVQLYTSSNPALVCTKWSQLTFPSDSSLSAQTLTWNAVTTNDNSSTMQAMPITWTNLGSQITAYGYAIYLSTILWTLIAFPSPIVLSTNMSISVEPSINLG